MDEEHRKIVDCNLVEIRRVLEPDGVLPYFIQENLMTDEDITKIRAGTTRYEKVDVFMDVLKRSNERAFDVFVEALENVHEHLAWLLLRSKSTGLVTRVLKSKEENEKKKQLEEMDAVKEKLETTEKEKQKLEKELSDARKEKKQLQKDLKETTNKLSEESKKLREKYTRLQKMEAVEKKLETTEKEKQKLEKELSDEKKEKVQRQKDLKEAKNQSSKLSEENKKLMKKCTQLQEMGATSRSVPKARVFSYKSDFKEKGIHAQGTNFDKNPQISSAQEGVNPGGKKVLLPDIRVIQLQAMASTSKGKAKQPPNNERGRSSCTEEQRRSWWCIDLGEKCSLFLTHFTLRLKDSKSHLYNWVSRGHMMKRSGKRY